MGSREKYSLLRGINRRVKGKERERKSGKSKDSELSGKNLD